MAPVKPVSSELPATVSLQSTAIYFLKKINVEMFSYGIDLIANLHSFI